MMPIRTLVRRCRRHAKVFAPLVLLLVFGATLSAQVLMPLPPFERTFSADLTRGFWFESPVDFTISGLRVPDEIGFGLQNVEVIRLPGAPPDFPATTEGVSVFRSIGQPSANILAANIPVATGDFIGILGATGDASVMHNSYGPDGPFISDIMGQPVTLTRFGMQFNLATTPATQMWSEEPFNVGRIEMYYVPEPSSLALLACGGLLLIRRR